MEGMNYELSMDVALDALLAVNPQEFYESALLEQRSTSLMRPILNLKEKTKIGKVGFEDPLLPFGCEWQGTNSDLSAKEMECDKVMIQTEICLSDIETSFVAQWLTAGTAGVDLPAQFRQHFFNELARAVSNSLEYLTWQGDKSLDFATDGSLAITDGLNVRLANAVIPTAQRIAATATTAANIIDKLKSIYDKIPATYREMNQENILWFIPSSWAGFYKQAVASASNEMYFVKNPDLSFLGIKLEIGYGMVDNTSVVSRKMNYCFLADLISDQTNLTVVDMTKTAGIYKMRVTSTFKFGINILNDAEFVVYGIDAA